MAAVNAQWSVAQFNMLKLDTKGFKCLTTHNRFDDEDEDFTPRNQWGTYGEFTSEEDDSLGQCQIQNRRLCAWERARTPSPENYLHPMIQHPMLKCDASLEKDNISKDDVAVLSQRRSMRERTWDRESTSCPEQNIHPMLQRHLRGMMTPRSSTTQSFVPFDMQRTTCADMPQENMDSEAARPRGNTWPLIGAVEAQAAPSTPTEVPFTMISLASLLQASAQPVPPPPPATKSRLSLAALYNGVQIDQGTRPDVQFPRSACHVKQFDSEPMSSLGSVGHPVSCGDACKYASKSRGCKLGTACDRCHLCMWSRYR